MGNDEFLGYHECSRCGKNTKKMWVVTLRNLTNSSKVLINLGTLVTVPAKRIKTKLLPLFDLFMLFWKNIICKTARSYN